MERLEVIRADRGDDADAGLDRCQVGVEVARPFRSQLDHAEIVAWLGGNDGCHNVNGSVRLPVALDAASGRKDGVGQKIGCGFAGRSEEHTSELQSLMRISYAVFCLK